MIGSRLWILIALRFNQLPPLLIQMVLEEVVEIVAALSLIPAKEVEGVHVGHTSRSRPLHWLFANSVNFVPLV